MGLSMAIRLFTISFDPKQGGFHDEEVNKFLLNKQVKTVRPEFFHVNGHPFWTMYIEYETVLPDRFRETSALNEPQRLLLQRLREWRREKAEQAGIPVFIIATNSELLALVTRAPRTLEALRDIRGFGKKKVERYGKELLDLIAAFYETPPVQRQEQPSAATQQQVQTR
jgi:superfamily II DNA helicase RecQ